jgi:hypothetical protein
VQKGDSLWQTSAKPATAIGRPRGLTIVDQRCVEAIQQFHFGRNFESDLALKGTGTLTVHAFKWGDWFVGVGHGFW